MNKLFKAYRRKFGKPKKFEIEYVKAIQARVDKSVKAGEGGAWFEFGTWEGVSASEFCFGLTNCPCELHSWQCWLFDSFEGLPEFEGVADAHPAHGLGSFCGSRNIVEKAVSDTGYPSKYVNVIEGFYEVTLTNDLLRRLRDQNVTAKFVSFDCDYYSSTKTAFDWILPLLRDGSILYFDDIYFYNGNPFKGQLKLINEINSQSDYGVQPLLTLDSSGRTFVFWRNDLLP